MTSISLNAGIKNLIKSVVDLIRGDGGMMSAAIFCVMFVKSVAMLSSGSGNEVVGLIDGWSDGGNKRLDVERSCIQFVKLRYFVNWKRKKNL